MPPSTALSRPDNTIEQRFQLLIEAVIDYGIFMLDPSGHIVSWNIGAEKLKGYQRDEIIGKHFSIFYPPAAVASGWPQEELRRAIEQGRFEDEGWRVRKDGTQFWANVTITPLYGDVGELTGFAKITRDLTERKRHEEQLRVSEERFRLLLGSVRDYAIFMLDPAGFVRSWNTGAQAIKGYQAEEIIGRHFSVFYPPQDQQQGRPQTELASARQHGRYEDESWRVRKDGTFFWANVIVTAVHDATGELIGFAKITRDMTERRKLEDLERSSQRMNEFLAMLAHELRNPLAPIRNAVSILQLDKNGSPSLQYCRDVIDRQLTHVTHLVDDLLDVGRLMSGKIHLRRQLVRIGDVIAGACETARPPIEARRHTLQVDLPAQDVHVDGDPARLSQVVQNLLINAAKYTPEGGRIEIKVAERDGFVHVSVADNGHGISAQDQKRIFELFAQVDTGTAASADNGLGIGLTLARSLVEMHGGALDVHSEGLGRGSTFAFWLPAAQPPADARPAHPASAFQQALAVLVVDDNRDAADSTAAILRLLGQRVECAYDGQSAVGLAQGLRPALILLDLAMPGMDGYQTLHALRATAEAGDATFVAVTGFGTAQDKRRTVEEGFHTHLTKPIDLSELVLLLNKVMQGKGREL